MILESQAFTVQYFNRNVVEERPFTMLFATDSQCVIGDNSTDSLPWRCYPDLLRFKQLTMGNVVVIGARTYRGLIKTWPGTHVLKGRDVVVIYGVDTPDFTMIEDARGQLEEAASCYERRIGERLMFIPCPRSLLARHVDSQRMLLQFQDAALVDIRAFCRDASQKVFVSGGAAVFETLFELCGRAMFSLIHHSRHVSARAYLGPKVTDLVKSVGFSNNPQRGWDAVDEESKTMARYYVIDIPS